MTINPWFISGFVDGEGSFHVAFNRRDDLPRQWSVIPEFHISQHEERIAVLQEIREYFRCGSIKANHAQRSNDLTYSYVVRNRLDLLEKIIPFFEKYPLRSEKSRDFMVFAGIVRKMQAGVHRTAEGFNSIVRESYRMNGNGRHRRVRMEDVVIQESSETICQGPHGEGKI